MIFGTLRQCKSQEFRESRNIFDRDHLLWIVEREVDACGSRTLMVLLSTADVT